MALRCVDSNSRSVTHELRIGAGRSIVTNTLLELGTFTVDPALANRIGASRVEVSAFSITETLGSYGSVTATPAERINASGPPSHASSTDRSHPSRPTPNTNCRKHRGQRGHRPRKPADGLELRCGLSDVGCDVAGLTNQVAGSSRGTGIKESTVAEPAWMFLLGIVGQRLP